MTPIERLLTAILDGQTLMQAQLQRIETRLDAIDAVMAGLTDVEPALEQLLTAGTADREEIRHHFGTVATIAAFTHAAVMGAPASLPVGVADDSLLDRYAIDQPSATEPRNASLKLWHDEVGQIETLRLAAILERQYGSSPTDTPASRVLRYQFAAISRDELKKRGVLPPRQPRVSRAENPSAAAKKAKSADLANLWRGGATPELLAEPELAQAVALFSEATRNSAGSDPAERARLHADIACRIESGERFRSTHSDRHHGNRPNVAMEQSPPGNTSRSQ